MKKVIVTMMAMLALMPAAAKKVKKAVQTDREYWTELTSKMAQPV